MSKDRDIMSFSIESSHAKRLKTMDNGKRSEFINNVLTTTFNCSDTTSGCSYTSSNTSQFNEQEVFKLKKFLEKLEDE